MAGRLLMFVNAKTLIVNERFYIYCIYLYIGTPYSIWIFVHCNQCTTNESASCGHFAHNREYHSIVCLFFVGRHTRCMCAWYCSRYVCDICIMHGIWCVRADNFFYCCYAISNVSRGSNHTFQYSYEGQMQLRTTYTYNQCTCTCIIP